jgi:hypothetical protein
LLGNPSRGKPDPPQLCPPFPISSNRYSNKTTMKILALPRWRPPGCPARRHTRERERRATASPPQHSPACLSQEARASTLGLPGPRGRHAWGVGSSRAGSKQPQICRVRRLHPCPSRVGKALAAHRGGRPAGLAQHTRGPRTPASEWECCMSACGWAATRAHAAHGGDRRRVE